MDFDNLLKTSLAVVNDGYQVAVNEVKEVVQDVSEAIARNAGEQFSISASEVANDMKGATYRIYFDTDKNNMKARLIDVIFIRVPSTGYPLLEGRFDKATKSFYPESQIASQGDLAEIFGSMIKNPESSLIQAIGYALRTKYDEIPF